jgi:hypothetical protein
MDRRCTSPGEPAPGFLNPQFEPVITTTTTKKKKAAYPLEAASDFFCIHIIFFPGLSAVNAAGGKSEANESSA